MIINMLQNLNNRYSSHNNNIKYISLTIKCMDFKPIHNAINMDVVSSFIIFDDFNSMYLSMYY